MIEELPVPVVGLQGAEAAEKPSWLVLVVIEWRSRPCPTVLTELHLPWLECVAIGLAAIVVVVKPAGMTAVGINQAYRQ